MSDLEKNIERLNAARDFAEAANGFVSSHITERAYICAKFKEQGFDALMLVFDQDEYDSFSTWYALRGNEFQIASSLHNEKLREVDQDPEFRTVSCLIDLRPPLEEILQSPPDKKPGYIGDTQIAAAFFPIVERMSKFLDKKRAGNEAISESFSTSTITNEIKAAELSVTGP